MHALQLVAQRTYVESAAEDTWGLSFCGHNLLQQFALARLFELGSHAEEIEN